MVSSSEEEEETDDPQLIIEAMNKKAAKVGICHVQSFNTSAILIFCQ